MTDIGADLGSGRRAASLAVVEHTSAWVAIGSLGVVLEADAGRQTSVVVWVLLACTPALLFTRPWQRLPTYVLALLALLPATAIAVCYLTPTQFAYTRDLAVWAYAAVLAAVAAAYLRTPERRTAVLLFVCVLVFTDFAQGFVVWRYEADPARAIVGTFYQQDMFGAFCVALALGAAIVALLGEEPWRWVGWATSPVAACGVVLSTSRAAEGLLLLGIVVLLVLAVTSDQRKKRLLLLVGLVAVSVGLLFLLTGPVFFPAHGGSPIAGTTRRAGSDSLGSSWSIRGAYWLAAVREFVHAPLAGEGFGAFGLTFFDRAPVGAFGSRYAHNGLLQGLGEGGLLFGVPLVGVVALGHVS